MNIQDLDDKLIKALRLSERNICADIDADSARRRETDQRIQREINKNLGFDMQLPLENHRKVREDTHQKFVHIFSEQIVGLSNDISQEFSQNEVKMK